MKVEAPVSVKFDTVYLTLLPPRVFEQPYEGGVSYPWAWAGLTRLKFKIGEAQVSKRVTAKWHYPEYYDRFDKLDPADAESGRVCVERELRRLVARHGFELPDDIKIELREVSHVDNEGDLSGLRF